MKKIIITIISLIVVIQSFYLGNVLGDADKDKEFFGKNIEVKNIACIEDDLDKEMVRWEFQVDTKRNRNGNYGLGMKVEQEDKPSYFKIKSKRSSSTSHNKIIEGVLNKNNDKDDYYVNTDIFFSSGEDTTFIIEITTNKKELEISMNSIARGNNSIKNKASINFRLNPKDYLQQDTNKEDIGIGDVFDNDKTSDNTSEDDKNNENQFSNNVGDKDGENKEENIENKSGLEGSEQVDDKQENNQESDNKDNIVNLDNLEGENNISDRDANNKSVKIRFLLKVDNVDPNIDLSKTLAVIQYNREGYAKHLSKIRLGYEAGILVEWKKWNTGITNLPEGYTAVLESDREYDGGGRRDVVYRLEKIPDHNKEKTGMVVSLYPGTADSNQKVDYAKTKVYINGVSKNYGPYTLNEYGKTDFISLPPGRYEIKFNGRYANGGIFNTGNVYKYLPASDELNTNEIVEVDRTTDARYITKYVEKVHDKEDISDIDIPGELSQIYNLEYTSGRSIYPVSYIETQNKFKNKIRNYKTEFDKNPEKYWNSSTLEYKDSIISKKASFEDGLGKDEFYIDLKIEGKSKFEKGKLDVMMVLDNSFSMRTAFDSSIVNKEPVDGGKEKKLFIMTRNAKKIAEYILGDGTSGNRVGVVNFSTLWQPTGPYHLGKGHVFRDENNKIVEMYKNNYFQGLTTSITDIKNALPNVVRDRADYPNDLPPGMGKTVTEYNFGTEIDGPTNISSGIIKGAESLYAGNDGGENRTKILLLLTDGMPTASYAMKNDSDADDIRDLIMDTTGSTYNGHTYTINSRLEDTRGLLNTDSLKIGENLQRDYGLDYNNHIIPTIRVSDFYKNKYSDLNMFTVLVDSVSNINFKYGEKGLSKAIEYINRISSSNENKGKYSWHVSNIDDFNKYLDRHFKDAVNNMEELKTIDNGIAIDPMGDDIELILDNKGFTSQDDLTLKDGGYILTDSHGYKRSGKGKDVAINPYVPTQGRSLLDGVDVSYDPIDKKIKIKNLKLGKDESINLRYRAKLKTKDQDGRNTEETFYQCNKKTYLLPRGEGSEERLFPIPSISSSTMIIPSALPNTGVLDFKSYSLIMLTMVGCYHIYKINTKNKRKEF